MAEEKITPEQIKKWQARWVGKEDVIDELIKILKGNGPVKEDDEPERDKRYKCANNLLKKEITNYDEDPSFNSLDLRGINLDEKDCNYIFAYRSRLQGAQFRSTLLKEADLSVSCLQNSIFCWAQLQRANLRLANLNGSYIYKSRIQGANFQYSKLGDSFKKNLIVNAIFCKNHFLPHWREHFFNKDNYRGEFILKLLKKPHWKDFWNHWWHRWNYTNFEGVNIDEADTTMAPDLYRYVKDQQYINRFKKNHPIMYWFWKIFSDCGGKLSVVTFWGSFFVWLFAKIHIALSWGLMPCMMEKFKIYKFLTAEQPPLNLEKLPELTQNLSQFWRYIFVSFDIFSNLGIRSIYPNNTLGVLLILAESVTGFMMLGMLISVLSERFARRS